MNTVRLHLGYAYSAASCNRFAYFESRHSYYYWVSRSRSINLASGFFAFCDGSVMGGLQVSLGHVGSDLLPRGYSGK